jgi:hypothetical protein
MYVRLQIRRNHAGTWSITGLPQQPLAQFEGLGEALQYAKREYGSALAVIELPIDGLYVVVYQERGWPNRICAPASTGRQLH